MREKDGFVSLIIILSTIIAVGAIGFLIFSEKIKLAPSALKDTSELTTVATITKEPVVNGCFVAIPPESFNLDPFYKKYCLVHGIPIISSSSVSDLALKQAWNITVNMLSARPDLLQKMIENSVRVGVIGANEVTTDMPEYRNLKIDFPETDWDTRTRGLGGTMDIPLSTGAEENLLCYENDKYFGESIFLHEFSHTIKDMALVFMDPSFEAKLKNAYDEAIAAGKWENTYADDNIDEYWAEGVQSYFDSNLESDPADGIHNFVNTRKELKDYDPKLYQLIAAVFPPNDWRPTCPK